MMFLVLVTLISMLLAVIMSVIAWRVAQEEKRRSDARVAALAADIQAPRVDHDLELRGSEANVPIASMSLFDISSAPRTSPRLTTVVGIGVLVVGSVGAIAVLFSGGSGASTTATAASASNAPATSAKSDAVRTPAPESPVPLELLALGHERDGARLTVRGVVRNPASGRAVERLTAVVFLYNRDGGFLSSGRAAIELPTLGPGRESMFIVTVPDANNVGRYRVSFRTEDRVVPHVDRRDHGQEKS